MGLFDVLKRAKDIAEKVSNIVEENAEKVQQKPADVSEPAPSCEAPVSAPQPTVNMKAHFDDIIGRNFADCEYRTDVPAAELLPSAHPACTPVQYMFYKNGAPRLAVVLVKRNTYNGMNVKGTKNICAALNIPYIRFFAEYPNEEQYVVNRIKENLK